MIVMLLKLLGLLTVSVSAVPTQNENLALLGSLNENATPGALKYQPVIDFDSSACYNTAAIDTSGRCNEGLEPQRGNCRTVDRLQNSNTYVRELCTNDGWCFYLYGYYFEKDEGAWAGDHKHDWKHLAVWTLHSEVKSLAWSAHGDYSVDKPSAVEWEGNHPKFVVHRGGGRTHSFRRAKDNEKPENGLKRWCRSPLVSVQFMGELKDKMVLSDWGSAHSDLLDGAFNDAYWETWRATQALG